MKKIMSLLAIAAILATAPAASSFAQDKSPCKKECCEKCEKCKGGKCHKGCCKKEAEKKGGSNNQQ